MTTTSYRTFIGRDGWTCCENSNTGLRAYLRFALDARQRWVVRELMVDATQGGPVSPKLLADLPIAQIESTLNARRDELGLDRWYDSGTFGHCAAGGDPASGSNVAVLASHYDKNFVTIDPSENWCAAAQFSLDTQPVAKIKEQSSREAAAIDYRLPSGPGPGGLTDDFLTRVGWAYAAAVARREPPHKTIARDITASEYTVRRWVVEARRRGLMPASGGRGKRG